MIQRFHSFRSPARSRSPGRFRPSLIRLGLVLLLALVSADQLMADIYYVEPRGGSDFGPGTRDKPFLTLEKALEVVRVRANRGLRSDRIYLRGGIYRQTSTDTQYDLTLIGTPEAPAILSAMPAEPGAPGAVQRKSGQWYEKVVFDGGWIIRTPWVQSPGRPEVWETMPQFALNEWPADKLKWALPTTKLPEQAPQVYLFSLAPFMVLQDNRATVWAVTPEAMKTPGDRHYDFMTGKLSLLPFDGKNPNNCVMESWYGGSDKNGHLLRDGEGRALFDGNLEHAEIRGFDFRLLTRTFEFHRRGYAAESERVRQRHVLLEDNEWRYCYIHLLLDANTVNDGRERVTGMIPPDFADRSHWTVRNNLFFRPTKECFQVHGEGHIFEYNEIIEHGGPWAGPAARVGAVNCRNMPGAIIRHNFIWGHDINPWDIGSVFMIEAQGRSHADANGDNIYGGQLYEHNVFTGINAGPAIAAGKGGCRMRDITIRYNLFSGNRAGQAIQIASPHKNLNIYGNIFHDQAKPIAVLRPGALLEPALPSTIRIENNIFAHNRATMDPTLLDVVPGSTMSIKGNVAHQSAGIPAALTAAMPEFDPGFVSAASFDFRLAPDSPLRRQSAPPGPYNDQGELLSGANWILLRAKYPAEPFQR